MSVITWQNSRTVDICFKLDLAYSCMYPWLLVGMKTVLQVEPTQTHSEWFMG